ncbi:hypothetical protein DPMN_133487 [Dreissena polymorpha]|uniref:B box-type domain-containing protein n=1 Tax=Dreissena polymorpha TaxID=45954 RepID=A0A9D4J9U1_DREPO|nr:hypothetical protein DPMN_133487 [Dreissena polymorpha]
MATVEKHGFKRDSAGDFIGEFSVTQSCEPCMKTNVSKTATFNCNDCDEFLCDACKNPHTVYKGGKHDIVKCRDRKSVPVGVGMKGLDICQEHDKEIEFFCHDHSKLCCSKCLFIHRKCDHLDDINNESGQKRHELHELKQLFIKLKSDADAIIAQCKKSELSLDGSVAEISSVIDTMRDRIIKLFEDAKQKLLSGAIDFKISEVRRIGNKLEAASKLKEEILKELAMFCDILENGTPIQQYIYAIKFKEKLNTVELNLNKQDAINISSIVTVSFPKELTTLLEMGNNFIQLHCGGNKTVGIQSHKRIISTLANHP